MIVFRKRFFVWLIKAYIKKWGGQILLFIAIGIIAFYFLFSKLYVFFSHIALHKKETIGLVGTYTPDNLPQSVLENISSGLTKVSGDDKIAPALAKSWKIQDSGKTYVFTLNNTYSFTDSHKLESSDINYKFSDATIIRPNQSTVVFKLKDTYNPFLVTVARPIFRNGFIGIGPYKVADLKLNGNFVQSITLTLAKVSSSTKKYIFYPTSDALRVAFLLGEIGKAENISESSFSGKSDINSSNTKLSKKTDYSHLVTIFYNMGDPVVSDKKIRLGLSYGLTDNFLQGERTYVPYPPFLFAYTDQFNRTQDIEHAKLLLQGSSASTQSADLKLNLKVLHKYKSTADTIAKDWQKLGIKTTIEEVDTIPSNFQIFLGDFRVPSDPDQYMLWHSSQDNNITNYKNLRIDKLLEDGRKVAEEDEQKIIEERKKIYYDFQKYLLDDSPASFLYFPYEYTIERR